MTRLRMNTHPEIYSKEWSHPVEDTELHIPGPHRDSPALPRNGHKQSDGVVRTLGHNARALVSRYVCKANAAIETRERLEEYFERDFEGVDEKYLPTKYTKVITGFLHMPLKMRFGLEYLHLQLCRLIVALCCCEDRFLMAQQLAAAARSVHCPDYFEYVDDSTVPCPEFDLLEKKSVLSDGSLNMSDEAETRRLQVKLDYFYKTMGLEMPFGLSEALYNDEGIGKVAPHIALIRASRKSMSNKTKESQAKIKRETVKAKKEAEKEAEKKMMRKFRCRDKPLKGDGRPSPGSDVKTVLKVFKDYHPSDEEAAPLFIPPVPQPKETKQTSSANGVRGPPPPLKAAPVPSRKRLLNDTVAEVDRPFKKSKRIEEEVKVIEKDDSDSEDDDSWLNVLNRPRAPQRRGPPASRCLETCSERLARERSERKEQREQRAILDQCSLEHSKKNC